MTTTSSLSRGPMHVCGRYTGHRCCLKNQEGKVAQDADGSLALQQYLISTCLPHESPRSDYHISCAPGSLGGSASA
eukprot:254727-Chlamydomonas_euryale.AAC.2